MDRGVKSRTRHSMALMPCPTRWRFEGVGVAYLLIFIPVAYDFVLLACWGDGVPLNGIGDTRGPSMLFTLPVAMRENFWTNVGSRRSRVCLAVPTHP